MDTTESRLVRRARRAYEWGRLRQALGTAAWVAPMAALSAITCGHPWTTVSVGLVLSLLVTLLLWRGGDLGRGVRPGLLAGLAPLLLPAAACGHACIGGVCVLLPAVCVIGGTLCGLVVAAFTFGTLPRRPLVLSSAFAVAGLVGAMGCLLLGLSGVVGMAAGMALGATPLAFSPRPHPH
jgi:hypothetical protein